MAAVGFGFPVHGFYPLIPMRSGLAAIGEAAYGMAVIGVVVAVGDIAIGEAVADKRTRVASGSWRA